MPATQSNAASCRSLHRSTSRSAATSLCAGLVCALLLSAGGCQFPRLYRVTVQQGNVITQEMINKLKPGMTRSQVAYVMGDPILKNTFNGSKWDYIYTVDLPGYYQERRQVTLFFTGDVLAYLTGDIAPQTEAEIEAAKREAALALEKAEQDAAAAAADSKKG